MGDYMREIRAWETVRGLGSFTVMESENLNSLLSVLRTRKWKLIELNRRGNVYRMRLAKKSERGRE